MSKVLPALWRNGIQIHVIAINLTALCSLIITGTTAHRHASTTIMYAMHLCTDNTSTVFYCAANIRDNFTLCISADVPFSIVYSLTINCLSFFCCLIAKYLVQLCEMNICPLYEI